MVHPVTFLKYKPLRSRVICSTVAWIITLGSCLCFVFRLISFNVYIYVCFFSIQFSLLLSIQLFCCLAVLRALKQSGPGERRRDRRTRENHMKRRAFYLILITTVSMTVIYVPFTYAGFSFILTRQYVGELLLLYFFVLFWLVFFSLFFICTGLENSLASAFNKSLNCSFYYNVILFLTFIFWTYYLSTHYLYNYCLSYINICKSHVICLSNKTLH